jgi:hypothetical protein
MKGGMKLNSPGRRLDLVEHIDVRVGFAVFSNRTKYRLAKQCILHPDRQTILINFQ